MDYETKATNRRELRLYALLFRSICGFTPDECIDPIALLDRLPDSDGTPSVEINIEQSTSNGGVKQQKIHFVKEK